MRTFLYVDSRLDEFGLTPVEMRVLVHLARRANPDGESWPGVDSMAKIMRVRRRAVSEAVAVLAQRGVIEITRRPGWSSVYRLKEVEEWGPKEHYCRTGTTLPNDTTAERATTPLSQGVGGVVPNGTTEGIPMERKSLTTPGGSHSAVVPNGMGVPNGRQVPWAPQLDEVLVWGQIDGVTEEVCRDFFDWHSARGWMSGETRITNPRFLLKKHRVRPDARTSSSFPADRETVYTKKTRLEALEKEMLKHPANPKSAAFKENCPEEKRADFRKMRDLAARYQREIAGIA